LVIVERCMNVSDEGVAKRRDETRADRLATEVGKRVKSVLEIVEDEPQSNFLTVAPI
jgi:hypothetical protein